MELNVSGEICSFAQEEEALGLSADWQLQKTTETNKMVKMYLIDFVAISPAAKNEKELTCNEARTSIRLLDTLMYVSN